MKPFEVTVHEMYMVMDTFLDMQKQAELDGVKLSGDMLIKVKARMVSGEDIGENPRKMYEVVTMMIEQ